MLTGDLALNWRRGGKVGPRYLDETDKYYLQVARDLIDIVRENKGRRRREIEEEIDEILREQRSRSASGDENAVDDATLTVAAHRLEVLIYDRRMLLAANPAIPTTA